MTKPSSLNEVSNVFRAHGYEGATMSVFEQATGLKRSSLYHHYPEGKLGMALASLAQVEQQFGQWTDALVQSGKTPEQRLRSFCKALDNYYCGGNAACLIASFSLTGTPLQVIKRVSILAQSWIQALASCYQQSGSARAQALTHAQAAVAQLQGALLLSQVSTDLGHFKRALRTMAQFP